MTLVWIGVAVLIAAATVVFLRKASAKPAARVRPAELRKPPAAVNPQGAAAAHARTNDSMRPLGQGGLHAAAIASEAALPARLAGFHLIRADDLPQDRREALVKAYRDIPRPPKLLHHLLSPSFVNTASSVQLVELITAEPPIAARVIATVNSPLYGLKAPVTGIGQAVTYLGLTTVRVLCLRYILTASFKADSPERKRLLDTVWKASAVASELTQDVSQRLGLEDRGGLVSAVVLSFLGRLATTARIPPEQLAEISAGSLLERTIAEQSALGLGAGEIGRLLMSDWGLPPSIVAEAADIDTLLVTPATALPGPSADRLALCYLCARAGERLADGTLGDLLTFDISGNDDADFFHARGLLAHPAVARAAEVLRYPEVDARARQVLTAEH